LEVEKPFAGVFSHVPTNSRKKFDWINERDHSSRYLRQN